MDERPSRPARRPRAGRRVRLLLSLGAAVVVVTPGTQAAWTDQVTGRTTISTGSVDLKVQNSDAVTGYTSLNLTKMEPGDSSAGLLTINNAGTAPLNYYVDATVSNAVLGSSLTAKVTLATTTDGVTCTGSALPGSGTFGPGLLGSSSAPQGPLTGGTSHTLCIQASMANNGVADGTSTTIGFTVRGSTGTGSSGWTDAVPVSGTSITTANAFYLGATSVSAQSLLLRRSGPVQASHGSVTLAFSGPAASRAQRWVFPIPAGGPGVTLSGLASLRIWSVVGGSNPNAAGALQVTLSDCDLGGVSCNSLLTSPTYSANPWGGGGEWVSKTIPINLTALTRLWPAGRSIGVTVTNVGSVEMMLAFDSTAYRSALLIN